MALSFCFLNLKNDSSWTLCVVKVFTNRRGVMEKSFFNQFYWSEFWSRKWNTWKIWGEFFVADQNEEWTEKRMVFSSYCCSKESKFDVWKKFCKRAKIFVYVWPFKAVFSIFLVKRFCYEFVFNFRLVLVVAWRFLELHMSFMLIRWFFMYFADHGAKIRNFMTIILFYCLKRVLKIPLWLEQFLDNMWLQFCGYEAFFFEKYDKKWRKFHLFF